MPAYSTITLRAELKERLTLLKGRRSWDEFLGEIADDYPSEELIAELERRLDDIRSGRVRAIPWEEVKAKSRALDQRTRQRRRAKARRRKGP